MQTFPTLLIIVHHYCSNFSFSPPSIGIDLCLPLAWMPAFGDVLNSIEMGKSLFKLNLPISDLSLKCFLLERASPDHCNYRFIQSSNSQSPFILFRALTPRHIYFANLCVYLFLICFCHKRICPWDKTIAVTLTNFSPTIWHTAEGKHLLNVYWTDKEIIIIKLILPYVSSSHVNYF